MELGISGVIGLLFGSVIAWLALRSQTASLGAQLSLREKELSAAKADLARLLEDQRKLVESRARLESALEMERKTSNEKIDLLNKAGDDLQNAFKALAADALKSNNSSFLQVAQETLKRFQSEQNLESTGKINSLSLIALGLGPKHDSAPVRVPVPTPTSQLGQELASAGRQ